MMETGAEPTLAELKEDPILLYKVRVLLYDLCHISNDRMAEARTLRTTDELYISAPYFTPAEAARIKAATVVLATSEPSEHDDSGEVPTTQTCMTIEEAIQSRLVNFLDKRKASGDLRPCGPHDLGPIYRTVFDISLSETQDEKFLSRLRRTGLGDSKTERPQAGKSQQPESKGNAAQKDGKKKKKRK